MNEPRPLGYWFSTPQPELPRPQDLVRPGWIEGEEREALLTYLRSGAIYETWRGLSYCRFDCGLADAEMGCRDLTDGLWVWPEGLSHYVEQHEVRLPESFVGHARGSGWRIPADALSRLARPGELDHSDWIAWASTQMAPRGEG